MRTRVWAFVLVMAFGGVAAREGDVMCRKALVAEVFVPHRDVCSASSSGLEGGGWDRVGVTEGDEATLHKMMNLVHKNRGNYIAVLFYACWCPFSKICRPNFSSLASLYPTIHHFAFEESAVRPSILSRYGVHGFPTFFLMNSTMRVRYHGPRTIKSLIAFYGNVTGIESLSLDSSSLEKKAMRPQSDVKPKGDMEPENCPFSWARSPEKVLQQDTYLALATAFVVIRLLFSLSPKLFACVNRAWRWHIRYASLLSLSQACLDEVKQSFGGLYPSKRSNLQEGAKNARAWASKSLVSVSIGESSSGGVTSVRETG